MTAEPTAELSVDVRRRISVLLDDLANNRSGLHITIDEVHAGARAELRAVATLTQHLIREDREFALVMAGLPSSVSSLLSDDVLTFLRRADKQVLSDVSIDEVHDALVAAINANGRTVDAQAGEVAAEATGGYPFLVQLVGYHLWRSTDAPHIDATSSASTGPVSDSPRPRNSENIRLYGHHPRVLLRMTDLEQPPIRQRHFTRPTVAHGPLREDGCAG
ncbi:MAG: hypothetical protein ABI873_17225 [Marmoricola sp.]